MVAVLGAEAIIGVCSNIAAISVTTVLALQSQSAQVTLREQANLLDLTHDTIFVFRHG
jgi:two-component system, LuxR family, sensor kinase FixL